MDGLQRKSIFIFPAKIYLSCKDILPDLESIVCSTTLSRPPLLKSMIQFNHEAVDEWWEVGQQLEFNNEVKSLSADPPSNIERENHTTAATKSREVNLFFPPKLGGLATRANSLQIWQVFSKSKTDWFKPLFVNNKFF